MACASALNERSARRVRVPLRRKRQPLNYVSTASGPNLSTVIARVTHAYFGVNYPVGEAWRYSYRYQFGCD